MTVAALPAVVLYAENGVTREFAVPFRFRAAGDLIVERIGAVGGLSRLVLGTDYSVGGGATDQGGGITLTVAGVAGNRLRIRRRTARAQPLIYTTGDRFPAKSHEDALDRDMLIEQEQDADLADLSSRAIALPIGEMSSALPARTGRINKLLGFDATGLLALFDRVLFKGDRGDIGPPGPPGAGAVLTVTPEMFGAKGDGIANDHDAFTKLAAYINARGGGVVEFSPGKTYLVGKQTFVPGAFYQYDPPDLLKFVGCTKGVFVRGNGAVMLCASGLRFGVFNPDGSVKQTVQPYYGNGLATPYRYMISFEACSGPIGVSDITLDGNKEAHILGGGYDDTGWQIPATGIFIQNCSGTKDVRNVRTRRHALDGWSIDDPSTPGNTGTAISVKSELNGRQGLSIVGARGWTFVSCAFNDTGRLSSTSTAVSALVSNPGAGVDMEAEGGKTIRDCRFINCETINNFGTTYLTVGDVADIHWHGGRAIGTTNYALFLQAPRCSFTDMLFMGATIGWAGAKLTRCRFLMDSAKSPTGSLYTIVNIADPTFGGGPMVKLKDCIVDIVDPVVARFGGNFMFEGGEYYARPGATLVIAYGRFSNRPIFVGRFNAAGQLGSFTPSLPLSDDFAGFCQGPFYYGTDANNLTMQAGNMDPSTGATTPSPLS